MSPQMRGVYAAGAALAVTSLKPAQGIPVLVFLGLTFAITFAAIAALGPSRWSLVVSDTLLTIAVRSFLGISIVMFLVFYLDAGSSTPAGMVGRLAMSAVVVGSAITMARNGRQRVPTTIFFVSYTMAMVWLLYSQGFFLGYVDVTLFHEIASSALREGINPYSITFPDLYGAMPDVFYGPGVSVDGVLQFGYPYLPLGLLATAPFEWLFSDFRLAQLLAIVGAGVMMTMLGSGWVPRASAATFLLIAPFPAVLAFGFTEPIMVLALMAVLLSSRRRGSKTPYLLGLVLATKQVAVLLFAPSFLLYARPWSLRVIGRDLAKTLATLAALTLPFLIWNPSGFYRSVVALQFMQPFRPDSLAFPALFANYLGGYDSRLLIAVPLAGVGLVAFATMRHTPTGAQGFALASALSLLVAFAFSKQAFANYYLVPFALLVGAAALADESGSRNTEDAAVETEVGSSGKVAATGTQVRNRSLM